MTAEIIARNLGGRRFGTRWMARCPAHDDHNPSLEIKEGDVNILVRCYAGCEQRAVIDALRARGLWPERPRQQWTPEQRREFALRRRAAEVLAADAWHWRRARIAESERAQIAALEKEDWPAWKEQSRRLYLLRSSTDLQCVQGYIAARESEPEHVERLVQENRRDEAHAAATTALIVAALAQAEGAQGG